MTRTAVLLGLAALGWSAAASADTASDIRALEDRWAKAFMTGDNRFLQRLLAPEFKLMRTEGNRTQFTNRAQWFERLRHYKMHEFEVRTVDVVASGNTAVATIQGRWKVGMPGRDGTREENFILSDTFVRRGGAWRVLYRHSTPSPMPAAAR